MRVDALCFKPFQVGLLPLWTIPFAFRDPFPLWTIWPVWKYPVEQMWLFNRIHHCSEAFSMFLVLDLSTAYEEIRQWTMMKFFKTELPWSSRRQLSVMGTAVGMVWFSHYVTSTIRFHWTWARSFNA
jgi:hypothetical protein